MKINHLRKAWVLSCLVLILCFPDSGFSQPADNDVIKQMIVSLKKDERGPFEAIRWFCPDGEILPAKERCPKPGGIQHAIHKKEVKQLADQQGIYFGQILAGTTHGDFLDQTHQFSRLKQYQIEKYLQIVDDGWILRRGRFYRGAIQIEDEEAWGNGFLKWMLSNNPLIESHFFLARQTVKDIPQATADTRLDTIRALAKTIADALPAFDALRAKIHGSPDVGDLARVNAFQKKNQTLSPELLALVQDLITNLESIYQPADNQTLSQWIKKIPQESDVTVSLKKIVDSSVAVKSINEMTPDTLKRLSAELADAMMDIRVSFPKLKTDDSRLAMMSISLELEQRLFITMTAWQPKTTGDLLLKAHILSKAATGCGFLELWEWQAMEEDLPLIEARESLDLLSFQHAAENYRRMAEWGTGMVRATYESTVGLFSGFEPLAEGFIDNRVRGSILLPLGDAASGLNEIVIKKTGSSSQFMGLENAGEVRGLNPGYAFAELEVVTDQPDQIVFSDKKIYAMQRAPGNIKPVAGILTVSEGNMVSHVQLLARNLGIPNAVLSLRNLKDLAPFSGQTVFYAVSPGGRVVLKTAQTMSQEEKNLFDVKRPPMEKIHVPTEKINLKTIDLIPLSRLRSKDSGRICGPKAANLGQLKHLFPERVGEGIVIPFGLFRRHLDQPMPETDGTYWDYLTVTFTDMKRRIETGESKESVEKKVLDRLAFLQDSIRNINLIPGFKEKLEKQFIQRLGKPMGSQPVFIRSDTNMEDLKEFTGAGLNLTLFNVVDQESIFQGIREVWASPYAERSFRWRQMYLLNPENVFPSILILPTVSVDTSGVMITTGVSSGIADDVTVAFSRGPGGAVDGQAAESYLLKSNGSNVLLAPARDGSFNLLPASGGTLKGYTSLNQPVLTQNNLDQLRDMAKEIQRRMPGSPGVDSMGPFDVELGFKDNALFLFQVRPYVENKRARSTAYMQSLDPELNETMVIRMDEQRPQ